VLSAEGFKIAVNCWETTKNMPQRGRKENEGKSNVTKKEVVG
jgi:hypothetical protein